MRPVTVEWFKTTDDVVWTGRDGKPRCARHPYTCLVPVNAVLPLANRSDDAHVCATCWREELS